MKKRSIALVMASVLAVSGLVGCGAKEEAPAQTTAAAAAQAETKAAVTPAKDAVTIKLTTTKSTNSYAYEGLEMFKAQVEEESGGSLIVELYPASQLGGQNEQLEGMGMGTIEMAYISAGAAEGFYPKSGLPGVLFTARDEDHALKIWQSEKGQEIVNELTSEIGVRFLDFSIEGVRSVWSKAPIEKLEDLKGLKVRVPEVPMFINTFESLGVNPTPMALSEVYTGLQTNIVDGLEYDTNGVVEYNFTDHCKYCYETKHGVSIMSFMVSETFWNNLSDDQRAVIEKASEEISAWLVEEYYTAAAESRAKLEEQGVTFVTPTAEEQAKMAEVLNPILADYIKDYATQEDLEALKAIQ